MLVSFHQTILKIGQNGFRNSPFGSLALGVISLATSTEVLSDSTTMGQEDNRTERSSLYVPSSPSPGSGQSRRQGTVFLDLLAN